jgi:hypothetical protein
VFLGVARFVIFDPSGCGDVLSLSCGIEVVGLLPWGKLGKIGRFFGLSDEATAIAKGFDEAADATNSGIKITDDGLEHILDRHTAFGTSTAHKSVFFDGEDITSLIRRAEGTTPIPQPGGNLAYIVHGDDVLGVDIATGLTTDLYTVITKPDGTLVTAFPGLPTGGR